MRFKLKIEDTKRLYRRKYVIFFIHSRLKTHNLDNLENYELHRHSKSPSNRMEFNGEHIMLNQFKVLNREVQN